MFRAWTFVIVGLNLALLFLALLLAGAANSVGVPWRVTFVVVGAIYLLLGATYTVRMKKSKALDAYRMAILLHPRIEMKGKRFWKNMRKDFTGVRSMLSGSLMVKSMDLEAEVYVDGKKLGPIEAQYHTNATSLLGQVKQHIVNNNLVAAKRALNAAETELKVLESRIVSMRLMKDLHK